MKRESCRIILFKDDKILLMFRERKNEQYYVFPGGGIEPYETHQACLKRECEEELGIRVKPIKYIYKVIGNDFIQHFYLCKWIHGELGTGNASEYDPNRENGLQKPMFINVEDLTKLVIVSKPIVENLLEDIKKYGYDLCNEPKEIKE